MTRVAYVGALVANSPGGVTVRNAFMVDELKRQGVAVELIDTGPNGTRNRLRQLRELIAVLRREDQVVLSVAHNGTYALVVLLALASLVKPKLRVVMLAVGRVLPNNIRRLRGIARRFYVWCVSRLERVYVQGEWLREELEELGLDNAVVLPNPRPATTARWSPESLEGRRLAFVSRVTRDKGIEQAMAAVELLRAEGYDAHLDVYGWIAGEYRERFEEVLRTHPGTSYGGVLTSEQVPHVLAEHAVFVLPTTWDTEGTPGAVVEAGMVGIPVVASDIAAVREVVEDGVSGLLIDPHDPEAIAAAARRLFSCPDESKRIGDALRCKVLPFELGMVVKRLRTELAADGWA